MSKTASLVIDDLYPVVAASPLATALKGTLYKGGMRPQNALTEDAVIDFLSGTAGQIQTGTVSISVFVPNVDNGSGSTVCDLVRCAQIEAIADQWIDGLEAFDGYQFALDEMIHTALHEESKQYCVNIKLKFNYTTF